MADIKILVVEDDAIEALDIKRTLEALGYSVPYVACKGEEAVEKALELMPDLILMDIILKGKIDGIDAASQIKSLEVPVIFLTAHSEETTIEKAKLTDPYGYLIKPFDVTELKYAIELAIYKNKMHKELKESEVRFKTVADFTYDWEYWINPEGNFLYVSPSCERITGYSSEEFIKTPTLIKEIIHPDDKEKVIKHLHEELTSEKFSEVIRFRITTKQGTEKWIGHGCQPVYNDEGTFLGRRVSNRDISERKKIEDELRSSNEWLSFVQKAAKTGFWDWNIKTGKLKWSSEFYELFGLDFDLEPTFDEWLNTLHPDDRDKSMETINQAITDHSFLENEYRVIHPDGEEIWIRALGTTYYDDAGKPQRMSGICLDITESKKAEIEQKILSEQRQLALDAANMGWWNYDPITDISTYDDGYKKIFGVSGSKRPNEEILQLLHPDDLPSVWKKVKNALDPTDPKPYHAEYRIYHNNEMKWIEAYGMATFEGYGGKKHATSLVGTVTDITERKKMEDKIRASEEKYRNALDNMMEGCQIISPDWKYLYVNDAVARHGRIKKEDLLGYTMMEVYPGIEDTEMFAKLKSAMEERLSCHLENYFIYPDGNGRWFELSIFPVPEGIFILSFDVTDRKNAEKLLKNHKEDLENLVKELTRSNKDLEQFAYIASHDLQEPLRSVSGFLQLLTRRYGKKLDPKAEEYVNISVKGVMRMQTMIEDLLMFSRVSTHGKGFKLINTNDIIDNVVSDLQSRIKKNNASVTHDDLPSIVADGSQIYQVFQNLISNAIKFHSKDPPQISISAEEKDDEWVFAVEDNGIGIDSKYHEEIFEVFKRLHPRRRYSGTGIGLAIVRKIVGRHNGRVWVDSKIGEGSTFYFTISKRREFN